MPKSGAKFKIWLERNTFKASFYHAKIFKSTARPFHAKSHNNKKWLLPLPFEFSPTICPNEKCVCEQFFERELALLVALQGESSWKGCWGDIKTRR